MCVCVSFRLTRFSEMFYIWDNGLEGIMDGGSGEIGKEGKGGNREMGEKDDFFKCKTNFG